MFAVVAGLLAVTSVSEMSFEEKVHELFIVPAKEGHLEAIRELKPGGILFKQSQTPADQVAMIHKLGMNLLCCADAEWGISMRIKEGVVRWPKNLTLGAIQNLGLLVRLGAQIGRECHLTGVDINLAPVVDSPENPAIGMRSFGDNPKERIKRDLAVMMGMRKQKVFATAKHYPGLQKSTIDPHTALPVIDRLELQPFETMVRSGVECILTTHVMFQDKIVTFSPELVKNIIRDQWGFDGLIFTDALNMQALPDNYGENAVRALEAGHDCLLYGSHIDEVVDDILRRQVPEAIAAIKAAIVSGRLSEKRIDESVARILKFKKDPTRLTTLAPPPVLNTPEAEEFKQELFRQAITLIGTLPPPDAMVIEVTEVTAEVQERLEELQTGTSPYVIVLYTSPYVLMEIGSHSHILVAYENEPEAHVAVEEILAGKIRPKGKLPIYISPVVESTSQ